MPLPLTVSCFSKIQIGFQTFLVPAHPGSPGKRAVKRVCVCVCVRACVRVWFSLSLSLVDPAFHPPWAFISIILQPSDLNAWVYFRHEGDCICPPCTHCVTIWMQSPQQADQGSGPSRYYQKWPASLFLVNCCVWMRTLTASNLCKIDELAVS